VSQSGPSVAPAAAPTEFRPTLARPVRALGRSALVTAAIVVLYAVVVATGGRALRVLVLVLVVAAVAVTLGLGARVLLRLTGRGPRLVLDADGYTNTTGRAPRRVSWSEVERLSAVTAGGRMLLVGDLAGDRTSVVLLRRLGANATVVEQAMRDRLNVANGYSPLS